MRFTCPTAKARGGAPCSRPKGTLPGPCPPAQPEQRRNSRCRFSLASHNGRLEVELAGAVDVQGAAAADLAASDLHGNAQIDCLGLAQAMVDLAASVDDDMLAQLGVDKGSRRLVCLEERASVLAQLEGREYSVAAAGSLSNTLMGLARLGHASAAVSGEAPLRVCMAGLVGDDVLGDFYVSQMQQAGVHVACQPLEGAATGTVVVLTSPDAQRSMLSYLGTPAELAVDAALRGAIARSRLLVVEGYLWELPGAQATISKAIAAAQQHGCVVAMTAGDVGVVQRHHADMWAAIRQGVDLLLTNAGEAAALLSHQPSDAARDGCAAAAAAAAGAGGGQQRSAEQLATALGPHCSMVVVTAGDEGSCMTALGQLYTVPPCWLDTAPVDTCGAGDAYAAGLLYGYLRHLDVVSMGRTAARVASAVISKHGAALSAEAALALAQSLPRAASLQSASSGALAPSTPRV